MKQCMSQLNQVGVHNSVSQVLLCFWHLFCSTQEQKLQGVVSRHQIILGQLLQGGSFYYLWGLFQTHFLNLTWEITMEALANLPLQLQWKLYVSANHQAARRIAYFVWRVGGVGKEGPSKKYIVEDVLTGSHSGHCVGRQFHGSFVNLPCFPKHRARLYRAPSPPSVSTA